MLGIGVGGTAEKAMLLAKESLMEPLDMHELLARGPNSKLEELRIELYTKVNALGIGAQGLGGLSTVLDVKISDYPTHAASKPIAMTCAMFPANVPQSDGPQNLQDALDWVLKTQENGVHLVCAGEVHDAVGVQKIFSDRSHAFASRQEASLQNDTYESKLDWPMPSVAQVLLTKHYPRVELIYNHSGADGQLVKTLLDAKKSAMSEANMESKQTYMTQGLVIAGTGSGTISQDLLKALEEAQKLGLWVARTSRCAYGVSDPDKHPSIPSLHNLSPVQGRVAMILALIAHAA